MADLAELPRAGAVPPAPSRRRSVWDAVMWFAGLLLAGALVLPVWTAIEGLDRATPRLMGSGAGVPVGLALVAIVAWELVPSRRPALNGWIPSLALIGLVLTLAIVPGLSLSSEAFIRVSWETPGIALLALGAMASAVAAIMRIEI